jgi:hypothetical protein
MEKLVKALGKMLESLLTSKTALLMLIVVAILCVAILAMVGDSALIPVGGFFGLDAFATCKDVEGICPRAVVGLLALLSIILILVRAVVWIIGKIREKYFV